eukprot:GHVU01066810.1.p1 GENE.GHVU01066810.1~~GHVU01066810.1.p1  ORF type:complete len:188 (+),score=28.05 GHVU01066810.1:294-857(+)
MAEPIKKSAGAYLHYEEQNGYMVMYWRKDEAVPNCLLFAGLTSESKLPEHKYKGMGKSNIASKLQGNKQSYYQSFCEFVKVARKEKCTLEALASIEKAPIPVKIIIRTSDNKVGYNPTGTIAGFAVAAAPLLLPFSTGTPVADAHFSPVGLLPTGTSPVAAVRAGQGVASGRRGSEGGGHRRSRCGA